MSKRLYYIAGLDTGAFFTDEENDIEKAIIEKKKQYAEEHSVEIRREITALKESLKSTIARNVGIVRSIRKDRVCDRTGAISVGKWCGISDSTLARSLRLKDREFSDKLMIIRVYYFGIAESIIKNGFTWNGYKYVFFSASAGQIRTKKFLAIREDLLNEVWDKLSAGLTIDSINECGGVNANKYLAYLSLCSSGTEPWVDFDIDRSIVVPDFRSEVYGVVDFIDYETYSVSRGKMNLPIEQTDGCGMVLPSVSKKNFMVRMPWFKGLLAVFDFRRFVSETGARPVVKDIWGAEHDIIAEDITVIFTESQFKMWKFYSSWSEYKTAFKRYGCEAGRCNIEEDRFSDCAMNYQMIQTLRDLSDQEIKQLARHNVRDIQQLGKVHGKGGNLNKILKLTGATKQNPERTAYQECVRLYPELLRDPYAKEQLRELKNSLERDLWSGKFKIHGKYTFVVPDLYALCEYLFLGEEKPKGLLKQGEVSCRLFHDGDSLDCLRSPHLYCEHAVRTNCLNSEWFETDGIYISSHDFISRILQCDFDGDKLLVTDEEVIVNAAKRNTVDIVPLYYHMKKAVPCKLSADSIYNGLVKAYTSGNIGIYSNAITKIWNKSVDRESPSLNTETLNVVKWLCMENNFCIDLAKTLFMPVRPKETDKKIRNTVSGKVPYFFRYAKDKAEEQTETATNSAVNMIHKLCPKIKMRYGADDSLGKLDIAMLMHDSTTVRIQPIIDEYDKIVKSMRFNKHKDGKPQNYEAVIADCKRKLLSLGYSEECVSDVLVRELFCERRVIKKKAFWEMFGDTVLSALRKNLNDKPP